MEANTINPSHSAITPELNKNNSHPASETKTGDTKTPPPPKAEREETKLDSIQMERLAESVNEFLKSSQTDLRVEIDRETKTAIFKIVRKDDQKVIKEIPPKQLRELAARIQQMVGSLVDSNA